MPDHDLIRVIGETPDPLTGTPARVVVQFFYDPDEQENYEEADRLIAAIAARVERYYAERPVSDAEVEAARDVCRRRGNPLDYETAVLVLLAARKVRGGADAAN